MFSMLLFGSMRIASDPYCIFGSTKVIETCFFVPHTLLTQGTVTLQAATIWDPESPASLLVAPAPLLFQLGHTN